MLRLSGVSPAGLITLHHRVSLDVHLSGRVDAGSDRPFDERAVGRVDVVDDDEEARWPVGEAGHHVVGDLHHLPRVVLLDGDHEKRADLSDVADSLEPGSFEHVQAAGGSGEVPGGPGIAVVHGGFAHDDRVIAVGRRRRRRQRGALTRS
nr:hypothetical protein [Pseudonocardia thermophila]